MQSVTACCNELFHHLSGKTSKKSQLIFGKDVRFKVLTVVNMKIIASSMGHHVV